MSGEDLNPFKTENLYNNAWDDGTIAQGPSKVNKPFGLNDWKNHQDKEKGRAQDEE